jgi:hypothetical protein
MSKLITDPSALVQSPPDEFWDKPVSRRAFQAELNKIGRHLADLWAAADTAGIMLNFIMEKKLMGDQTPEQQRDEIEAYVEQKKAQLEALRVAAIAQVGATDESTNR